MRVLHLPARTPFARNLHGGGITIVNGTGTVPIDASFDWLAEHFDHTAFDIVHIHTTELAARDTVARCFDACHRHRIGVLATLHEDFPLFDCGNVEFGERLAMLREGQAVFATLTGSCRTSLVARYGFDRDEIVVIPHGNVLPLDSSVWDEPRIEPKRFRFSIHGGFRPNKRLFDAVMNFAASPVLRGTELAILTRAVSSKEYWLNDDLRAVLGIALGAENIDLALRPVTDDTSLARFVLGSDAVILPYAWGSHSGQIELAADLGVRVIATNVGYYAEQAALNGLAEDGLVHWANWAGTGAFAHGAEMLAAMEQTFREPRLPIQRSRAARRAFRTEERHAILDAYAALYRQSRDVMAGAG